MFAIKDKYGKEQQASDQEDRWKKQGGKPCVEGGVDARGNETEDDGSWFGTGKLGKNERQWSEHSGKKSRPKVNACHDTRY